TGLPVFLTLRTLGNKRWIVRAGEHLTRRQACLRSLPGVKANESHAFRAPRQKRRRRLLTIGQGERKSRLSDAVSKAPQATFDHRTRRTGAPPPPRPAWHDGAGNLQPKGSESHAFRAPRQKRRRRLLTI